MKFKTTASPNFCTMLVLVFWAAFCHASAGAFADEPRVWKSADGKFSVEAEFVGVENDIVQLRRTDNNKTLSVKIDILSRRDQKYIRRLSKKETAGTGSQSHGRAAWMEGQWGFRFNVPGMRQPDALAKFDVQQMMNQIKVLDTASWVQINITQGANGSFYTSPHAELAKHVSPRHRPET